MEIHHTHSRELVKIAVGYLCKRGERGVGKINSGK